MQSNESICDGGELAPNSPMFLQPLRLDAVLALVGLGGVFGGGTVPRDFVEDLRHFVSHMDPAICDEMCLGKRDICQGLVARFECDVHPAVMLGQMSSNEFK